MGKGESEGAKNQVNGANKSDRKEMPVEKEKGTEKNEPGQPVIVSCQLSGKRAFSSYKPLKERTPHRGGCNTS